MTNTKPLRHIARHALTRLTIAPAYRPTGGTLLIIALMFLACDMALGGGPAIAALLYNVFIAGPVSFNDFLFSIFDAIGDFFSHLPDELNP
jgi:hypothetical protein